MKDREKIFKIDRFLYLLLPVFQEEHNIYVYIYIHIYIFFTPLLLKFIINSFPLFNQDAYIFIGINLKKKLVILSYMEIN